MKDLWKDVWWVVALLSFAHGLVVVVVLLSLLLVLGCGVSPLAPEPTMSAEPAPWPRSDIRIRWTDPEALMFINAEQPTNVNMPLVGPFTPPPNDWWPGGFICGFPEEPVCRFFAGYRWESQGAYCTEHQEEPSCPPR